MFLHIIFSALLRLAFVVSAIPSLDVSLSDTNPLGQPFLNAVLPVALQFSPRFSLFRRQGCPNLMLLCPSGGCCSYDASCCGNTCCPSGYLCTGGTTTAPCCVAIGSPTNTCGESNVSIFFPRDFRLSNFFSLARDQEICLVKESTFAVLPTTFVTTMTQQSLVARHWARTPAVPPPLPHQAVQHHHTPRLTPTLPLTQRFPRLRRLATLDL